MRLVFFRFLSFLCLLCICFVFSSGVVGVFIGRIFICFFVGDIGFLLL